MAETAARFGKHPIHPMLVVLPLGLWVAALVFDIVAVATGNPVWRTVAYWNVVGGIIGALVAAVPGFIDYLTLDGRAGRLATYHMVVNLGALAVFALNWYVRSRVTPDSWWPLALSMIGVLGVMVSGWLGGELVYVERVGVQEERKEDRYRRAA